MGDKKKETFVAFFEWADVIKDLPDEQQAKFFRCMFEYARTGEISENMNSMEKVAWNLIKNGIDRQSDRYERICERRREAGKRGAAVTNEKRWGYQESANADNMSSNIDKNQQESANVSHREREPHRDRQRERDREPQREDNNINDIHTPIPPKGDLKDGDFSSFFKELSSECPKDNTPRNLNGLVSSLQMYGVDKWYDVYAIAVYSNFGQLETAIWSALYNFTKKPWRPDNMAKYLISVARGTTNN